MWNHYLEDPRRKDVEPIVTVSTTIETYEDPVKVSDAIKKIFPEWEVSSSIDLSNEKMDSGGISVRGTTDSIDKMLAIIREARILDTALDVMSMNLKDGQTEFLISKQSASVGKVSFSLSEDQFGGLIRVCLQGQDLGLWLEQQTWHSGRDLVPRSIGDDFAMDNSGEAVEWFDAKGKRFARDD